MRSRTRGICGREDMRWMGPILTLLPDNTGCSCNVIQLSAWHFVLLLSAYFLMWGIIFRLSFLTKISHIFQCHCKSLVPCNILQFHFHSQLILIAHHAFCCKVWEGLPWNGIKFFKAAEKGTPLSACCENSFRCYVLCLTQLGLLKV